jgi:hypothetical protein
MKRIFVIAIVAGNLAVTASAALAEGNGYHQPFYERSSIGYERRLSTSQTGLAGTAGVATVTGPAVSTASNCPYCSFRIANMKR